MKWHVEPWRKAYVNKSASWLRLPVSARGLGRELLTYCDDDGRIDIGDDSPGVAIAYMLGARPKEHKRIAEDVAELLKGPDPYLVHEPGVVRIRNFVEAQDRTPGAKRTAAWRARKDSEQTSRRDVSGSVTCDVSRADAGDGAETTIRVVSNRVESKEEEGTPVGGGGEADAPSGEAEAVFGAYLDGWARHVGRGAKPVLTKARVGKIRARLKEHDVETIKRAAAGIWRSRWHVANKQTDFDLVVRDAGHVERFANETGERSAVNGRFVQPMAKPSDFAPPAEPELFDFQPSEDPPW